ncbi:hypothetical protein D3C75_1060760 [compost metagenome]
MHTDKTPFIAKFIDIALDLHLNPQHHFHTLYHSDYLSYSDNPLIFRSGEISQALCEHGSIFFQRLNRLIGLGQNRSDFFERIPDGALIERDDVPPLGDGNYKLACLLGNTLGCPVPDACLDRGDGGIRNQLCIRIENPLQIFA